MLFRYRAWDGTQLIEPFTADEVMEALSEELLADGDLRAALDRLLQYGDQGRLDGRLEGLRKLMEQLRNAKQQQLKQHNLNSVMDDITKKLNEIIQTERSGIDERLQQAGLPPQAAQPEGDQQATEGNQSGQQENGQTGERANANQQPSQGQQGQSPSGHSPQAGASPGQGQQGQRSEGQQGQSSQGQQAGDESGPGQPSADDPERSGLEKMLQNIAAQKNAFLDQLPPDPGGRIKNLHDYEFMSPKAREMFQELLQMLQQQVSQQYFQGIQEAIQNMSPEELQRMRDMVRDLNSMLEAKQQGRDPHFDEFMQKHGDFFPGVQSLEELMEQLQQRQNQMQSLLDSLSRDQRGQLQSMLDSLFRDDRLKWDLARLAANLQQMMPGRPGRYPFSGDEPLSLQEAMQMMQQLQQMDELERQLRQARDGRMEGLDPSLAEQVLGPQARDQVDQLRQLTKLLEDAGFIRRRGNNWELTSRGVRKIGQKALNDIFTDLKRDRLGNHEMDRQGLAGERIDDSKHYEFGDPFLLDLQGTLRNAIAREGIGSPVRMLPSDFDVYRTEHLTDVSTVLMIDLSRSMLLRGCFVAAKRVVMALNSLIRMQYPRDNLYIVGFSDRAREMKPEDLPEIDWSEYVYGTNLQHGLMLARHLLARHKSGTRQVIVITDGEPTAHIEEDGEVYFNYPPTYRTYQETLREVLRCTRERIVINTFMLERGHYLADFINQMTRINKGRAFFSSPERLGEYVLVDYVRNKKKRVS
jgi:uncharacterized protein with von Willebrand factor type A (vWA) domain